MSQKEIVGKRKKSGYHFHHCQECGTIWKHKNFGCFENVPEGAHSCPECGTDETYKYRTGKPESEFQKRLELDQYITVEGLVANVVYGKKDTPFLQDSHEYKERMREVGGTLPGDTEIIRSVEQSLSGLYKELEGLPDEEKLPDRLDVVKERMIRLRGDEKEVVATDDTLFSNLVEQSRSPSFDYAQIEQRLIQHYQNVDYELLRPSEPYGNSYVGVMNLATVRIPNLSPRMPPQITDFPSWASFSKSLDSYKLETVREKMYEKIQQDFLRRLECRK